MNVVLQTRDSRITSDFGYYSLFDFASDMYSRRKQRRLDYTPRPAYADVFKCFRTDGKMINFVVNCAFVKKTVQAAQRNSHFLTFNAQCQCLILFLGL